ncbi:MAG: hypothetical protein ABI729_01545 [Chitinophagales bacterium]
MKAIVLFFLISFLCFFSRAQSYHSFIHDTAIWDELEATSCCDAGNLTVEYYEVKWIMMGDTNMNDLSYKKLFYQVVYYGFNGGSCQYWWNNGIFFKLYLYGYVREDSSKKVFLLAAPDFEPPVSCLSVDFTTEKILYDFNVGVGDTVEWKPYNNVVTDVDSIIAPNGAYLRRIAFDNLNDYWVEGLGSTFAFWGSYMPPPFECGCVLECAQAIDLLLDGSASPCGGITVAVNEIQSPQQLSISPNPFSEIVSINSPFPSLSKIYISDAMGKIIFIKILQPFEKASFSPKETGNTSLVFFRLVSENGQQISTTAMQIKVH